MKTLLSFLRNILFTNRVPHSGSIPVYVRCERCGEALMTELNLQNDLSVEYGKTPRQDQYLARKTIIGSNLCFQRIELELFFDAKKKLVEEKIQGGTRIGKDEYERLTQQR
ncbi:MAG: hypothetical protein PVF85_02305 [Anaerolineales bacterium]|jgi:hypothetical protein